MITTVLLFGMLASPIRGWKPPKGSLTPILTYHDVIRRRGTGSVWFDCTQQELESQLTKLKAAGAKFVSISQIADHLEGRSVLPKGAIAITFADNYRGFYELAYPVLKRHRVTVTMFVHTGFVGSGVGRPKMNWSQLKQLDREGLVTVASQTVGHPADLAKLTEQQIRQELANSKRDLESHLGHRVDFLAYPNGKYDGRCEKIAASCGYRMAFSEVQAPAERSASAYSVNRYVHTKWRTAWRDARNSAINSRG